MSGRGLKFTLKVGFLTLKAGKKLLWRIQQKEGCFLQTSLNSVMRVVSLNSVTE